MPRILLWLLWLLAEKFTNVCTLRKADQTVKQSSRTNNYFGQPSFGFFFNRDFFTASRQLPSTFNTSAFGPGVARFLEILLRFFAILNSLCTSSVFLRLF